MATGMSIALWAQYSPEATAIISPTGNRTFHELNARANQLVRALRTGGLDAGDSVAIIASNRPEFAEVVFACTRAGLRYTPVNRYLSADEIAYIINDCQASALIGDARFADLMEHTAARCPDTSMMLSLGGDIPGFTPYHETLSREDESDIPDPQLGARMLYTSGTTGRPKGVIRQPNYSTQLEAITSAPRYQAGTGQLNLCTGPYYHGGPLTFSLIMPLSQGIGIVIMEKWYAATALNLIEQHRITHTHMVPTMFHHVRILDDDGNPCAPGEVGNIFLKGSGELDFEYLGDPEKTAEAHRDSRFTVGDIGYLDEDGFLFLTDRNANIIISGGVNIYPAEVEAVLLEHPGVKDVAVIGVPNPEWGEEVKAVVQVEQIPVDPEALASELIDYCRGLIAHFKCPRSVDLVTSLPRDDNGKLYRRRLLETYRPG
jgi:acyl-CoA synthetase (AMP-forming)/AMP-acid ligase II